VILALKSQCEKFSYPNTNIFFILLAGTRPQTTRSVALGVVVNIISTAAKRLKTTEVARDTSSRKLEVVESLPVDEINQVMF